MPGFRVPLKELPEHPNERRISVHWFFLPVGLLFIGAGAAVFRYSHSHPSSDPLIDILFGSLCIFVGVLELSAFGLCVKRIHEGRPPRTMFSVRVRPLILFGSIGGYMFLCFAFSRVLGVMLPIMWVIGAAMIWTGMVRYFVKHPPKN
jgi:hypothetical protein